MTSDESSRVRHVRKKISFTDAEWVLVERRMAATSSNVFETFARSAILDGEISVRRVAFDPSLLRAELSRIGNNINQIARQVNVEDVVTYEEMAATRALLKQVQSAINQEIINARGSAK